MRSDYINVVDNNGKNILHHIAENGKPLSFGPFIFLDKFLLNLFQRIQLCISDDVLFVVLKEY